MKPYDHRLVEKTWQKKWADSGIYKVADSVPGKENFYTLVEFSYPSGNLHIGHWYAFAVPDIFARYKRMQGFNVLYPTGFDAFGLPAENAAIKLGADPKVWTYEQMDKMRVQLRSMGAMFDWDREVVSCDPKYYKWTQWMFNQFLKNDLVYRDTTMVNWCPKDQTILANEQVIDGKCDRCGTEVIQKKQEQWMLRITKYADRLIDDLDALDWPNAIKESQKNWIGRSEGSEIDFAINNSSETITVFTTRADTLFGVTYVVLAPEHPLVATLLDRVSNAQDVEEYILATKKKSELDRQQSKEKTGVELAGVTVINPANGEQVPVWIADYVLAGYGTGAVMAVPAHDERDFEFAKKYQLPIKKVVCLETGNKHPNEERRDGGGGIVFDPKQQKYAFAKWNTHGGYSMFAGGVDAGENIQDGSLREVREESGLANFSHVEKIETIFAHYFNKAKEKYRVTSATCYLCIAENTDTGDHHRESHEQFDVVWTSAAEVLDWWIKNDGQGDYTHSIRFLIEGVARAIELGFDTTSDPKLFKSSAITEYGILENSGEFDGMTSEVARAKITEFVGGRLVKTYRLRDWGISRQRYWGVPIPIVYDPDGKSHPVPDEHLPWMLPTDVDHKPDGTAPLARSRELLERTEKIFGPGWKPEVETMDTFVDSSWYFYRYLDNQNEQAFASPEKMNAWMPIDLYMGGAEHTTMHLLYSRFWTKALHDLGLVNEIEAYKVRRNRGLILGPDGNKMSKSKGNVINPDEIVELLGADTVRMYLAFMGPYGTVASYPWDPNGVVGVRRFLERVWKLADKISDTGVTDQKLVHKTIKGIQEDIAEYKFNTAISKMMILANTFEKQESVLKSDYKILIQMLAPFAPHITDELWAELGEHDSIHVSAWPTYDPKLVIDDTVTIGIQINGKSRAEIELSVDQEQSDVQEKVLAMPEVQKWIAEQPIKKFIYVKGKIVSIVV